LKKEVGGREGHVKEKVGIIFGGHGRRPVASYQRKKNSKTIWLKRHIRINGKGLLMDRRLTSSINAGTEVVRGIVNNWGGASKMYARITGGKRTRYRIEANTNPTMRRHLSGRRESRYGLTKAGGNNRNPTT